MAIKDNRILVNNADSDTNWEDNVGGGGWSGDLDTDTKYQGSGSLTKSVGSSEFIGWYEIQSPQDWTDNEFYILFQCAVIGTLVPAGIRIRVSSDTNIDGTNYREWSMANSTNWPATSVGDAWYQFVIDINKDFTENGTLDTTNVQSIGYISQNTGMVRGDNHWIDAIYRRPYANPGLIIEGTNGGSPYTWKDVTDWSSANGIATFVPGTGGSFISSVPIQIGNTTTGSTHEFSDSNILLLWDSQRLSNANAYKIDVVNTTGSTLNITAGVKTATGEDATGAQGWTIQAAADANRWSLIANNVTANINLYGCTFTHSDIIRAESSNTEVISTFLIDGNEYVQSTSAGSSIYLRNTVINANTADGEAYLKTVDIDNIDYSTFEFSDGHAIEITTTSGDLNETSKENIFTGYSTTANTTDAAIYNNSGNDVTIGQTGGDLNINSYRNQHGTTTTITSSVTFTITNIVDYSEIRLIRVSDSVELAGIETVSTSSSGINGMSTPIADPNNAGRFLTTYTHDGTNTPIRVVVMSDPVSSPARYQYLSVPFTLENGTQSLQVSQIIDRVYNNP